MKALCSDGLKRHLYSDIKMNGEVKIGTIYWWDLDFALRGSGNKRAEGKIHSLSYIANYAMKIKILYLLDSYLNFEWFYMLSMRLH